MLWSYSSCLLHVDLSYFIFVPNFVEISKRVSELLSRHDFHNEIMYVELRFLSTAHSLILFYICTNFHANILKGFRVIEQTRFSH